MMIKTFNSKSDFIQASSQLILKSKTVALSGGNTPTAIYKELSKSDLSDINFYQVDERYVPLEDPSSNAGMILENLKPHHFTHFDTSLGIEESIADYEERLQAVNFDLVVLGIGTDGHFASIFPHYDIENSTIVTQTESPDGADRLTLGLEPILNSKQILILLQGSEKKKVFEELQNPSKSITEFPAHKLLEHENLTVHFLGI